MKGFVSDPLWAARLTGGRVGLFLVLGASCELPQQHRIFAYLAIDPERPLSMIWLSLRTGQICPIITGMIVVSMKPIPSSTVRPFWDHIGELTNSIDPKHIVSIDLCYICDNVLHPLPGMKQMVFLMLLTVVGMVVWTTRES